MENLNDLATKCEEVSKRVRKRAKEKGFYDAVEEKHTHKGELAGHTYWILPPLEQPRGLSFCYGGMLGYVHFKKRITIQKFYDGILTYVPVHGGITLARADNDKGMIYGFDTGHCDSDKYPRLDPYWMKKQIAIMIRGIYRARLVEIPYMLLKRLTIFLEKFNSMRQFRRWSTCLTSHLVQYVWNTYKDATKEYNLGIMLNILGGRL